MKAQAFYLTPRVIQLWITLDHLPTPTEKKQLEDRLENFALSNLAKNNRGSVYSSREHDRVGIIVVSEEDVLPYTEIVV
jgi:hypothetical protein